MTVLSSGVLGPFDCAAAAGVVIRALDRCRNLAETFSMVRAGMEVSRFGVLALRGPRLGELGAGRSHLLWVGVGSGSKVVEMCLGGQCDGRCSHQVAFGRVGVGSWSIGRA